MKLFHLLLMGCYRLMLMAYPPAYRERFAEEMESTFRQLLILSGQKPLPLLLIFLREVRSWPSNVIHAHRNMRRVGFSRQAPIDGQSILLSVDVRDDEDSEMRQVIDDNLSVLPWPSVVLAILPGVYMGLLYLVGSMWEFDLGIWASVLLMMLCITVIGVGVMQEHRLPVWCYPAAGLLLCTIWVAPMVVMPWIFFLVVLGMLFGWWYTFYSLHQLKQWISWQCWFIASVVFLSPVVSWLIGDVVVGDSGGLFAQFFSAMLESYSLAYIPWLALALAPFALRYGTRAALLVLGLGFWIWLFLLDFNYYLVDTAWDGLMSNIWVVMLLIVAPMWVLRAKGTRHQMLALILPVMITFVVVVTIEICARYAPHLLIDYVDLYRYFPDSGTKIHGVGLHSGEPVFLALLLKLGNAQSMLIQWILVVILYAMLGRASAYGRRMIGVPGWQRLRAVLLTRRYFFARG